MQGHALAVALDDDVDLVAGLAQLEGVDEVVDVADLVAAEADEQIALLQAGLVGGGAGLGAVEQS